MNIVSSRFFIQALRKTFFPMSRFNRYDHTNSFLCVHVTWRHFPTKIWFPFAIIVCCSMGYVKHDRMLMRLINFLLKLQDLEENTSSIFEWRHHER